MTDFDPRVLPGGNAMFLSSGDPDRDAQIAADIRRRAANEAEGLCPNGCGPITVDSSTEKHCERCGFIQQTFSLGAW